VLFVAGRVEVGKQGALEEIQYANQVIQPMPAVSRRQSTAEGS
jgi:hypothetical protein